MTGWGKRFYNWEFSAGVQHEILPRMSLDVELLPPLVRELPHPGQSGRRRQRIQPFSVVAPADPRLPDGGGYTVPGFINLNPSAFGRPANNLWTLADNYGKQIEHWNGVDVGVNARLSNGVLVQGGTSTGRTSTDNCDILDDVPEGATVSTAGTVAPSLVNFPFCHVDTNWLTPVKGCGVLHRAEDRRVALGDLSEHSRARAGRQLRGAQFRDPAVPRPAALGRRPECTP